LKLGVGAREAAAGSTNCAAMADLEDAYLSDLLSYSLERLNKEPELLKADGERVRRSMAVRLRHHCTTGDLFSSTFTRRSTVPPMS